MSVLQIAPASVSPFDDATRAAEKFEKFRILIQQMDSVLGAESAKAKKANEDAQNLTALVQAAMEMESALVNERTRTRRLIEEANRLSGEMQNLRLESERKSSENAEHFKRQLQDVDTARRRDREDLELRIKNLDLALNEARAKANEHERHAKFLETETLKFRDELRKTESTCQTLQGYERESARLVNENKRLERLVNDVRFVGKRLEDELTEERERREQTHRQLQQAQQQQRTSLANFHEAEQRIAQLNVELQGIREKLRAQMQQQVDRALEEARTKAENERAGLERALKQAHKDIAALREQMADMEEAVKQSKFDGQAIEQLVAVQAKLEEERAQAEAEKTLVKAKLEEERAQAEAEKMLVKAKLEEVIKQNGDKAAELSEELERLRSVYPSKDLLKIKEQELKRAAEAMKTLKEGTPERARAEKLLRALSLQCVNLSQFVRSAEARFDKQKKRIEELAKE